MVCHYARWIAAETVLNTHRLSAEMLDAAPKGKHRQHYLQGRILLAELMFYLYDIPTLPPIIASANGRPCFADSQLPDFSLAYTGDIIGVVLSDKGKVGLDLEVVRPRSSLARQKYLNIINTTERSWILEQQEQLEAATQLWCVRHSILKISGLGLNGMETLHLHPSSGRLRSSALPDVQVLSDMDDVLAWACAHAPGMASLVQWHYQTSTGLVRQQEYCAHQQPNSARFMKFTSLPRTTSQHLSRAISHHT